MTPKVLISDKLSPRAIELFKQRGIDADFRPGLSPEEFMGIIADYNGLAVRSASPGMSTIVWLVPA